MGRGRMVSGGGRGRMVSGGGRGRIISGGGSRSSYGHRSHSHTTVFIGGGHHYHSEGSPIVGIVVGAIFVLVGIFIVFGGFFKVVDSFKYAPVDATCISNEYSGGGYYATYEYTVDGFDYISTSNQSWTKYEDINEVVTIYYLKSDPNEIYEEKPSTLGEGLIIVFAGLIFGGMGSLPLVLCVKQLKTGKGSSLNETDTSDVVKEETPNRCHYCGSKYSKSLNSCPKCGASKYD